MVYNGRSGDTSFSKDSGSDSSVESSIHRGCGCGCGGGHGSLVIVSSGAGSSVASIVTTSVAIGSLESTISSGGGRISLAGSAGSGKPSAECMSTIEGY